MEETAVYPPQLLTKFYNSPPLIWKLFGLATFYSLIWLFLHHFLTGNAIDFHFLALELGSSILIFSVFNGFFITFNYYRWGSAAQFLISFLYSLPLIQLIYFQSVKNFLDHQTLSFLIREPHFFYE